MKTIASSALAAALLLHAAPGAAQRQLPPMKIEQLTTHVYRYGGLTNGAFIVGSEAIAVVDGQICGSERHAVAQGGARRSASTCR